MLDSVQTTLTGLAETRAEREPLHMEDAKEQYMTVAVERERATLARAASTSASPGWTPLRLSEYSARYTPRCARSRPCKTLQEWRAAMIGGIDMAAA